jgi:hypothetical protein
MNRKTAGALQLGGIFAMFVGAPLYIAGSFSPNASSCDGECVRPFLMDLIYYGGEVLFIVGLVVLVAVAVWQFRERRSKS